MKKSVSKRFMSAVFLLTISISTPLVIEAWQARPMPTPPKPLPSPNAPRDQNVPQGLEGVPGSTEKPKNAIDQQNQQEIRLQIQRLYAMATEMKDEADRTDANSVLSVTVLKRAQDIEKLAKQIRDRAKR